MLLKNQFIIQELKTGLVQDTIRTIIKLARKNFTVNINSKMSERYNNLTYHIRKYHYNGLIKVETERWEKILLFVEK